MIRSVFQIIGALGIIVFALFFSYSRAPIQTSNPHEANATTTDTTSVATTTSATTTAQKPSKTSLKPVDGSETTSGPTQSKIAAEEQAVSRIDAPYPFPPKSTETVNAETRAALVNIMCNTSAGALTPISGSGVIIDPKGVILTNAHVAQYLLLSTYIDIGLTCEIRTGSPAKSSWKAIVMYMPSAWVSEHAADIRSSKPLGTGENDYALLAITEKVDGSPITASFPYLPYDSREAIGFIGDRVLLASYPAEFAGGITTKNQLYASSAVSSIDEFFTFDSSTVDLISVGGVILAQSGSSGGAMVNDWGRLIGIITTTSDGATTADRDLRGISLSYVDRSLQANTGSGLSAHLAGDPIGKAVTFMTDSAPALIQKIVAHIPRR